MLLLDCGGIFVDQGRDMDLVTEVNLMALEMMAYDVLNLGSTDLAFARSGLYRPDHPVPFSFVSSNWPDKPSWVKNDVVKDVGGIRVAVLGVMPSQAKGKEDGNGIPPKIAIKNLIGRLRQKTDFIILLVQDESDDLGWLSEEKDDIGLVVFCGDKPLDNADMKREPPVVEPGIRGQHISLVHVALQKNGDAILGERKTIYLDENFEEDFRFNDVINASFAKKYEMRQEKERIERLQKLHKDLQKGLDLDPEEFMRQYQSKP